MLVLVHHNMKLRTSFLREPGQAQDQLILMDIAIDGYNVFQCDRRGGFIYKKKKFLLPCHPHFPSPNNLKFEALNSLVFCVTGLNSSELLPHKYTDTVVFSNDTSDYWTIAERNLKLPRSKPNIICKMEILVACCFLVAVSLLSRSVPSCCPFLLSRSVSSITVPCHVLALPC